MNTRNKHISRWLSVLLLMVFSIAVTPWNALHHHPEVTVHDKVEKSCTHELHLRSHVEHCLVCEAHFVKDFVNVTPNLQVFLYSIAGLDTFPSLGNYYSELVQASLRGPPVAIA